MNIKKFLKELQSKQKFQYGRTLKNKHPEVIKEINKITYFLDSECELKERVYCIINDIDHKKICEVCKENPIKFRGNGLGYFKHCSRSCSKKDKKTKEKYKKTYKEKYGIEIDCNFKLPNYYSDLKKSLERKYGVSNVSQLQYVKDKKRKTFQKNNNKLHPNWGNSWHEVSLPSGRIVKVQGYERFAIFYLLKDYKENEILISNKEIKEKTGEFLYEKNNKVYRYYPDFYIIPENKIIEVKSIYTLKNHIETTRLKLLSCKEKKIEYDLWIIDYKGNIINETPEARKVLKRIEE